MKILCKIFGHKIKHGSINTYRMNAKCAWCDKMLKVSYDMSYGETIVVGDYGNQGTFIWCHCGNELCSSDSWIASQDKTLDIEFYKCTKCGVASKWDFGAPCPIMIESSKKYCSCNCEIARMVNGKEICADCNLETKGK